jgi:hypothetical protein
MQSSVLTIMAGRARMTLGFLAAPVLRLEEAECLNARAPSSPGAYLGNTLLLSAARCLLAPAPYLPVRR